MPNLPRLTIVVPTIGHSPVLGDCLKALTTDREIASEVVVVIDESLDAAELLLGIPDRVIPVSPEAGFSAACNAAICESETDSVAVVNDDVVVDPGWIEILIATLENDSQVGAVQGVNLQLPQPKKIDGCGIAWNPYWQAIQVDHGSSHLPESTTREVYGVSGTAAMYSRKALAAASPRPHEMFDPVLHTYYEDVDLAGRLRSVGYRSELVPKAQAQHLGGASSSRDANWRYRQIYGNRILVLARLLGRSLWPRLAKIVWRDLIDLSIATTHGAYDKRRGILAGWSRASRLFGKFSHRGPSLVPISVLHQFMETREEGQDRR